MAKFSLSQIMNDQSKAPPKTFKVEPISIEKLVPSEMNKYTVNDVTDLKASIETLGLQQNLVVRERDAGTYEIISGHRRFKAMQELYTEGNNDFATIPCKIIKSGDDITAELQLLFANSTIRQMTDYERTYQTQRIKELLISLKKSGFKFQGRMRQIVADIMEMSPAQVGRMESINENLLPEFKEEYKAGDIGVTAAYELSRLPRERQAQELTTYKQSGTVEIKDIQNKRAKPEMSHSPAQKDTAKAPGPASPRKEDVERLSVSDIVRELKAIARDIESENDGSSFDICGACLAAVSVIEELTNENARRIRMGARRGRFAVVGKRHGKYIY